MKLRTPIKETAWHGEVVFAPCAANRAAQVAPSGRGCADTRHKHGQGGSRRGSVSASAALTCEQRAGVGEDLEGRLAVVTQLPAYTAGASGKKDATGMLKEESGGSLGPQPDHSCTPRPPPRPAPQ